MTDIDLTRLRALAKSASRPKPPTTYRGPDPEGWAVACEEWRQAHAELRDLLTTEAVLALLDRLERAERAVEVAYNLGAKDAQRLCAGVAAEEHRQNEELALDCGARLQRHPQMLAEERALVAARIEDEIQHIDPTRAKPSLDVLMEPEP